MKAGEGENRREWGLGGRGDEGGDWVWIKEIRQLISLYRMEMIEKQLRKEREKERERGVGVV
jgi:hypothetical protein